MSLSAKGEGWEALPIPAVGLLTEQLNSERAEVADPLGSRGWPGRGPGRLEPLPSGSSQSRRGSEPGTKVAVDNASGDDRRDRHGVVWRGEGRRVRRPVCWKGTEPEDLPGNDICGTSTLVFT